jgi:hypothetical protein
VGVEKRGHLNKMAIHFVSIKISVVSVTIRVVHAQGLLFDMLKNSSFMSHDARFVESGLTIDEQDVTADQVSVHFDPRV